MEFRDIQYGMKDLGLFVGLSLAFVCANVTVAYFWGFAYKSSLDATSFYPVLALLCKNLFISLHPY